MTHVAGFIVVFEADMHEDDARATLEAIKQLRGVLSAQPVPSDRIMQHIAEQRVRNELVHKLLDVVDDVGSMHTRLAT